MGSLLLDSFPYYTSALVLLVEFNMPFKSSLLFVAMLVGSCYGSCNRTISGYTWKFNATVDKDYSGITKEECGEKCLSVSWCKGYTWSLDESSGSICHIFHELNQQHACQECSKCISGVFTQITETSPGEKHCGANSAGWLSGGHPSSVGSTVDRTVYYEWSGNAKEQNNTITITNCGAFFVYYLKEHWDCDNRYCTE